MRLQSVEQQGREGEGHVRRGYGEGLNLGLAPWRLSRRGEPGVEENTHTGKWGQLLRLAPPSSLIQDVTVCQALRGPGGQRGAPTLQEGRPGGRGLGNQTSTDGVRACSVGSVPSTAPTSRRLGRLPLPAWDGWGGP